MNLNDYRKAQAKHIANARAIHDTAAAAGVDLTDEQSELFNNEMAEAEKFSWKIATLEKLETAESHLKESAGRYTQPQEVEPVHKDIKRYSLLKAIRDVLQFGQVRGLEAEVNQEIASVSGKQASGFYMPLQKYGNLDVSTGAGAVETVTDTANFIELLRAKMLAPTLGCRIIPDLKGNIQVPRQSGGGTAYWIAANGSNTITASNQTIDYAALTQKTVGASTTYTRQFVSQTSIDAENLVMSDLAQVLALELDRVGFAGSGSGAVPEGILYNSDCPTVALGTDGAAPTWAKMVELETSVASYNADLGTLAYIMTPQARGKCKTTVAASSTAKFIWETDNTVNGYNAYATNQLPHDLTKGSYGTALSACIFGNFADLLYGLWGGVDVIVNPYSADTAGAIRITVMQDADVTVRHGGSFAKIVDMVTT